MTEFLGSAAPSQLLVLIAFLLICAAFLGAYLVFFFTRRAKKGKMKLGSQTDNFASQTMRSTGQPDNRQLPPAMQAGDLNTDLLNGEKQPTTFNSRTPNIPTDSDLNLDILNNGGKMETSRNKTPHNEPTVDLAARLGSQANSTQQAEPVELLRLLRDPQSGQLIIHVGQQRYTKLADVADKEIGQYILKLAAHFLAFTNGMIATDVGVKSVYMPQVNETPQPIVPIPPAQPIQSSASAPIEAAKSTQPDPDVPKPSPEAEAAFLASLQTRPPQLEPSSPPSRGLFGRSKPAPTPSVLPALNLAKEINDIVQQRLLYSSSGPNNKVEITSALDGGIRINVNGAFYTSPDEVPDPEVKALIKDSIKQWERS